MEARRPAGHDGYDLRLYGLHQPGKAATRAEAAPTAADQGDGWLGRGMERVVDPNLADVEARGQTPRAGLITAPDAGREPGLVAVDPVDSVFGDVHRRDG